MPTRHHGGGCGRVRRALLGCVLRFDFDGYASLWRIHPCCDGLVARCKRYCRHGESGPCIDLTTRSEDVDRLARAACCPGFDGRTFCATKTGDGGLACSVKVQWQARGGDGRHRVVNQLNVVEEIAVTADGRHRAQVWQKHQAGVDQAQVGIGQHPGQGLPAFNHCSRCSGFAGCNARSCLSLDLDGNARFGRIHAGANGFVVCSKGDGTGGHLGASPGVATGAQDIEGLAAAARWPGFDRRAFGAVKARYHRQHGFVKVDGE